MHLYAERRHKFSIRKESSGITTRSADLTRKIREHMNNFMPINLATQMKWTNAMKDTNYQSSLKKK